jgi:hypothetical protein
MISRVFWFFFLYWCEIIFFCMDFTVISTEELVIDDDDDFTPTQRCMADEDVHTAMQRGGLTVCLGCLVVSSSSQSESPSTTPSRVGILYSPMCLQHKGLSSHPERPDRVRAIMWWLVKVTIPIFECHISSSSHHIPHHITFLITSHSSSHSSSHHIPHHITFLITSHSSSHHIPHHITFLITSHSSSHHIPTFFLFNSLSYIFIIII